jgi:hypothetical protein
MRCDAAPDNLIPLPHGHSIGCQRTGLVPLLDSLRCQTPGKARQLRTKMKTMIFLRIRSWGYLADSLLDCSAAAAEPTSRVGNEGTRRVNDMLCFCVYVRVNRREDNRGDGSTTLREDCEDLRCVSRARRYSSPTGRARSVWGDFDTLAETEGCRQTCTMTAGPRCNSEIGGENEHA